ncbi:MAG: DUF4276 family protein [Saprospiraceae bacterium]|nr:DUF4276 family protein [Saprospiraceae bacterium]
MNVLSSTFWGEGPSDERFLPKIIQRVLEAVLHECARGEWEVLEPEVLHSDERAFGDQIMDIAKQSAGFTLAFVHTDADARNEADRAIPYKIEPALQLIQDLPDQEVCKNIVAVVPVTKIENWKLADLNALREIVGVDLDWAKLGLNMSVQHREQQAQSKQLLSNVIREANIVRGNRRKQYALSDIDEPLAKRLALREIARYDSFQKFLARLKSALIHQNIIRNDCEANLS